MFFFNQYFSEQGFFLIGGGRKCVPFKKKRLPKIQKSEKFFIFFSTKIMEKMIFEVEQKNLNISLCGKNQCAQFLLWIADAAFWAKSHILKSKVKIKISDV